MKPNPPIKHLITIDEMVPSLSTWYTSLHWGKRKKMADLWHGLTEDAVKANKVKPINERIILVIECQAPMNIVLRDASNCAIASKLIEDGLVRAGILKDDAPEFVEAVVLKSTRSKDDGYHTVVGYLKAGYV